jgi:hypothetical protein
VCRRLESGEAPREAGYFAPRPDDAAWWIWLKDRAMLIACALLAFLAIFLTGTVLLPTLARLIEKPA